jgi:predicted outer membrane repeat protein
MTLINATTADVGAAVLDNGENLTLNTVQLENNSASFGGAVYVQDKVSVGGLTVEQSSFTDNSAPNASGGAIYVKDAEGVTIRNSTFIGNHTANGGALFLFTTGLQDLEFNTICNNTATTGGGVYLNMGTTLLNGNIIFGNTAMDAADGPDLFASAAGSMATTSSYNDVGVAAGSNSASVLATNNNRSVDPVLGPVTTLANGTKARAPQAAQVIDQVPAGLAPMVDQAGTSRPQGSAADIGAIELVSGGGGQPGKVGGPATSTGTGGSTGPGSTTGSPFAVSVGTNVSPLFRVTSAVGKVGKGKKKRSRLTVSATNVTTFDSGPVTVMVSGFQMKGKKKKPFSFTMSFSNVAAGQTVNSMMTFNRKNGPVMVTATTITKA